MDINKTDILAFIGALAWAPQIINWVCQYFKRPIITVMPDKKIELGYTTYGPIINLHLAINVEKKDTLLDFIGLTVEHEDGATLPFEWQLMTEKFSEIKKPDGVTDQIIQRDMQPIFLKLNTSTSTDRLIRFQVQNFIEENNKRIEQLSTLEIQLKKKAAASPCDYQSEFFSNTLYLDYLNFIKKSFWWRAGEYTVNFYVKSPVNISQEKKIFKFTLDQSQVNSLNENIETVDLTFRNYIYRDAPKKYDEVRWNWLYPTLYKN